MPRVIGLDIGGTKIRAGVVGDDARVHNIAVSSTNAVDGAEAIMGRVHDVLDGLLRIAPEVEAIGIGATGRVDTSTGQIVGATDMLPGWRGVALGDIVRGWFGLPVAVDNDGNAAAIGEAWAGAAHDAANFILLTLGTGVGGALVHEGRPIRGWSSRAGELGHMILYPGGRLCECGARGCLEPYASGPSVLARANESAGAVRYASPASVLAGATAGEPVARAATDGVTVDLAIALWSLANIYDPELFVLGGGLTEGFCAAWPDWPARLRARAGLACPVVRAELGADAVVVGAAGLHIAPGRPPSGASPARSVR
jgi:glucokinase